MSYPFVKAAFDYGIRKGPVKAFVVHMAEGGGTVGFLSRNPARGVSVHYVIEYSGRIVQMLPEDHASGSINPQALRTTDGPPPYGATAAKAVMGDWWHDPNSAVITVEIEGFAAAGPNVNQANALFVLVNDVRSRYPGMGLLGHRDFTSTKACPGAHIDWPALGGHGPWVAPVPVPATHTVRFRPFAAVRIYDLAARPGVNCIRKPWRDERWFRRASSAPCSEPVDRPTCDGTSSALTVKVLDGYYANQYLRVGHGVSVEPA